MFKLIKQSIKSSRFLYPVANWLQTRPVYYYHKVRKGLTGGNNTAVDNRCHISRITRPGRHSFFGYYDKCPWNSDGNYLLCLQVPFADRMPKPGEEAEIVLIDASDGFSAARQCVLTTTRAWSWQQGAMLQWFGGNPQRQIIYNDFDGGSYNSKIMDVHKGLIKTLPLPVYAVSSNGDKAVTLNFDRLHHARPGYGYVARPCTNTGDIHPADDGIWLMDLHICSHKLIISLEDIVNFKKSSVFDSSFHYFNHLEFNGSGNRFIFLHRWLYKNIRHSRLFTANADGSSIYCLSDYGMVSHFTWKDDDHILAWARQPGGLHYYLFRDRSNEVEIVGKDVLTEDGHPSYSPDHNYILTDTYPDRERMRSLILNNVEKNEVINLGRFLAPFRFDGTLRCDLHPRWGRDGKYVCFDSVHEGYRAMYILDLSNLSYCG